MLTGSSSKDYGVLPDMEEQLNPAPVTPRNGSADQDKEYKCKDVFMALVFLSGVLLMAVGLGKNMDGTFRMKLFCAAWSLWLCLRVLLLRLALFSLRDVAGLSVQWKNDVQGLKNEFSALTATKV